MIASSCAGAANNAGTKSIKGKQQSWSTQYGVFKGAIKSTQPVTVKSDDSDHNIIWPIGTQSQIDCSLQSEAVEPAQFILDYTARTLSEAGSVTAQKTVGLCAGQLHGFPYLSLFTEYTAGKTKTLKTYVIDTIVGAVVCDHPEAGHEELVLNHLHFFMQHIEIPFNFNLRKSNRVFLVEIDSKLHVAGVFWTTHPANQPRQPRVLAHNGDAIRRGNPEDDSDLFQEVPQAQKAMSSFETSAEREVRLG